MINLKLWWLESVKQKSILLIPLVPFAWVYQIILVIRATLYHIGFIKRIKLPVPVISVGNITLGGTGKTPFTEYLAKLLMAKGKKVVILSRGYGQVKSKTDDETSDLPASVIRLTAANRVKLGEEAGRKYQPDIIILDDGFQHGRLDRDLDIVMIDCLNPFGNRHIFPAGILREKLGALKRADLFVLSHTDLVTAEAVRKLCDYLLRFGKPIIKSIHNLEMPEAIRGKKVWGFCGIGNPDSFRLTLEKSGAVLTGFTAFPDHYRYRRIDISRIEEKARQAQVEYLITTTKDMIKIRTTDVRHIPLCSLKSELIIIEGREKVEEMVLRIYDKSH